MIKAMVIDNHPLFSYGIKYFTDKEKDIDIIHVFDNYKNCTKILGEQEPEVLIIDMCGSFKYKTSVLEFIEKIITDKYNVKVIVIIEFYCKSLFNRLLERKTSGFFTRKTPPAKIIQLIRSVADGQIVYCEELSNYILNPNKNSTLTQKELLILNLIYEEKTNKEIAEYLNYAPSTIDYYISNIMNKLEVNSRIGIVKKAGSMGLL